MHTARTPYPVIGKNETNDIYPSVAHISPPVDNRRQREIQLTAAKFWMRRTAFMNFGER